MSYDKQMGVEHWANRPEPKEDNGWISVEDRLPKYGAEVLIIIPVCERFNIEGGRYTGSGQFVGAWCSLRGEGCAYDVTHWMPLPPQLREQAS